MFPDCVMGGGGRQSNTPMVDAFHLPPVFTRPRTVPNHGQDYQWSTPDSLVAKTEIVGDVPGP